MKGRNTVKDQQAREICLAKNAPGAGEICRSGRLRRSGPRYSATQRQRSEGTPCPRQDSRSKTRPWERTAPRKGSGASATSVGQSPFGTCPTTPDARSADQRPGQHTPPQRWQALQIRSTRKTGTRKSAWHPACGQAGDDGYPPPARIGDGITACNRAQRARSHTRTPRRGTPDRKTRAMGHASRASAHPCCLDIGLRGAAKPFAAMPNGWCRRGCAVKGGSEGAGAARRRSRGHGRHSGP